MVYYYQISQFDFILIEEASAQVTDYFAQRKKEGTIQYGYRTWGTHAWEKQERNKTETDEDGKKRGVSMERSKAGTKKVPTAYHILTKIQ